MAKIDGRLVVSVSKWRIRAASTLIWCIGWLYAFKLMSEDRLDGIIARVAHWAVIGGVVSRVEWDDIGTSQRPLAVGPTKDCPPPRPKN